jgi:hypothetical protein
VEIQIKGENAQQDLIALNRWLAGQRGLVGRTQLVQGAPGKQELSGGAFELLTVALGSGGTVSVLAGALSTWLGSRRSPLTLTVGGDSVPVP